MRSEVIEVVSGGNGSGRGGRGSRSPGGGTRGARSLARALEAHRRSLASCRRCAAFLECPLPVLPESLAPRAMLIGQAPGRTETVDRRPFAGRAGRTLFEWLARAGLDERTARERLLISAITRCYPGPSPSGRGDRVPSREEQENCRPWLDDELRLLRPPLIILVGRLSISTFLGNRALRDVIGRAHTISHVGGESVAIPLPHPSGASSWIHQPGHAALLDAALALIGAELRRLGVIGETVRVA